MSDVYMSKRAWDFVRRNSQYLVVSASCLDARGRTSSAAVKTRYTFEDGSVRTLKSEDAAQLRLLGFVPSWGWQTWQRMPRRLSDKEGEA